MPVFHFHFVSDGIIMEDKEGLRFRDFSAAKAEAVASARELNSPDDCGQAHYDRGTIQITNTNGIVLTAVTFGEGIITNLRVWMDNFGRRYET